MIAARNGNVDTMLALMRKGAGACIDFNCQVTDFEISNIPYTSALGLAVYNGQLGAVHLLLKMRASTNVSNAGLVMVQELLKESRQRGHEQCVRAIEEASAREVKFSFKQCKAHETEEKACAHCGLKEKKLSECGRCRSIYFCSRECQKAHHPIHKLTCHKLKSEHALVPAVTQYTGNVVICLVCPFRGEVVPPWLRLLTHSNGMRITSVACMQKDHMPERPAYSGAKCLFVQLELSTSYAKSQQASPSQDGCFPQRNAFMDHPCMAEWMELEWCHHRIAYLDDGCDKKRFRDAAKQAAKDAGVVLQLARRQLDPGLGLITDQPECID